MAISLSEAFEQLSALNEETYDFDDDALDELKQDVLEFDDEIEVIDPEAETEEDIQDSYLGKIILNCPVCNNLIYWDKEEIDVCEGEDLVNCDAECPYCFTTGGFEIVGEVAPYKEDTDEIDVTVDGEDIDVQPVDADEEALNIEEDFSCDKCNGKSCDEDEEDEEDEPLDESFIINESVNDVCETEAEDDEDELKPESFDAKKSARRVRKGVSEGFNNVDIDTDDQHLHMDQDENGKTTVTTEPISNDVDDDYEGPEMITPLSDETENEIFSDTEDDFEDDFEEGEGEDFEDDLEDLDTESEEEPLEDEGEETEEETEEDIEEVDEESLDAIGESFLKGIYSNVRGYKTLSVSNKGNSLIAEGVIRFASGKERKTSFIFEADTCSNGSRGKKVQFKGYNQEINKNNGKKALSLRGTLNDKKLLPESLTYNFVQKDKDGKAKRLTGTVKR